MTGWPKSLRWPSRPATAVLLVCIFAFLVVPTGLFAVASGLGLNALPYELLVVRERIGLVFCAHMTASGLALICIPIAMNVRKKSWPASGGRTDCGNRGSDWRVDRAAGCARQRRNAGRA